MTPTLTSASFPALGTTATLVVTGADMARARDELNDVLRDVDQGCSRFRADSDLSRVNAHAGRPVHVGSTLVDALELALRAARLTDGDVDPSIGRAVRLLGYDRDFSAVAADGAPLTCVVQHVPGWQHLEVDRDLRTVQLPEGVELDLGATAKAYAADRAAAAIAARCGGGVLVSLGGDVSVAGTPPDGGWPVRVTDRLGADVPGETVAVTSGGLATSGTTARRWQRGGEELHHIVDPRSGRPAATWWRTVSVVAATCVDANTASTAAVVRGDAAPAWLAALGLAARLVRTDGDVLRLGGWAPPIRP
jgi:thiamine biosynthesis lipoprotein